jgi:hypothetical protein
LRPNGPGLQHTKATKMNNKIIIHQWLDGHDLHESNKIAMHLYGYGGGLQREVRGVAS